MSSAQPRRPAPIAARTRDRAATSGAGVRARTAAATPARARGASRGAAGPGGRGCRGSAARQPAGSVLPFGRHIGWSIGEIARIDPGYLAWLQPRREGEPYREEIDALPGGAARRRPAGAGAGTRPQARPVPLTAVRPPSSEATNAAIRSSASACTGLRPCPSPGYVTSVPPRSAGIAASSSSIRANGSDVPDRSSAGTSIAGQCAMRAAAFSGLPGGCIG